MASGNTMRKRAAVMRVCQTAKETTARRILKRLFVPVSTQVVIGKRYILDFVGKDRLFVLEIDGAYHDQQKDYDGIRDSLLLAAGFKIFRVPNDSVSLEALTEIKELPIVPRQEICNRLAYARLLSSYSPKQWESLSIGEQVILV